MGRQEEHCVLPGDSCIRYIDKYQTPEDFKKGWKELVGYHKLDNKIVGASIHLIVSKLESWFDQ